MHNVIFGIVCVRVRSFFVCRRPSRFRGRLPLLAGCLFVVVGVVVVFVGVVVAAVVAFIVAAGVGGRACVFVRGLFLFSFLVFLSCFLLLSSSSSSSSFSFFYLPCVYLHGYYHQNCSVVLFDEALALGVACDSWHRLVMVTVIAAASTTTCAISHVQICCVFVLGTLLALFHTGCALICCCLQF